jgi:hypothetical protein
MKKRQAEFGQLKGNGFQHYFTKLFTLTFTLWPNKMGINIGKKSVINFQLSF